MLLHSDMQFWTYNKQQVMLDFLPLLLWLNSHFVLYSLFLSLSSILFRSLINSLALFVMFDLVSYLSLVFYPVNHSLAFNSSILNYHHQQSFVRHWILWDFFLSGLLRSDPLLLYQSIRLAFKIPSVLLVADLLFLKDRTIIFVTPKIWSVCLYFNSKSGHCCAVRFRLV